VYEAAPQAVAAQWLPMVGNTPIRTVIWGGCAVR